MFEEKILFDRNVDLNKYYGLRRQFANDVSATEKDQRTLALLEQNGGNLPLIATTEAAIRAYHRLVRVLTDDPEHTFFK